MKRFDIEVQDGRAYLAGNPSGKYVRHEDVAELAQQCDQMLEVLERFDKAMEAAGDWPDTSEERATLLRAVNAARATIAAVKGGSPC